MNPQEKKQLEAKLSLLKSQLTGDIFADGEVMDQILEVETALGLIQPNKNSPQQCFGCGS